MIDTKEIILKLKEAKAEKNLSINDIVDLTNNYLSKTTVQRVFAQGSENTSFLFLFSRADCAPKIDEPWFVFRNDDIFGLYIKM